MDVDKVRPLIGLHVLAPIPLRSLIGGKPDVSGRNLPLGKKSILTTRIRSPPISTTDCASLNVPFCAARQGFPGFLQSRELRINVYWSLKTASVFLIPLLCYTRFSGNHMLRVLGAIARESRAAHALPVSGTSTTALFCLCGLWNAGPSLSFATIRATPRAMSTSVDVSMRHLVVNEDSHEFYCESCVRSLPIEFEEGSKPECPCLRMDDTRFRPTRGYFQ